MLMSSAVPQANRAAVLVEMVCQLDASGSFGDALASVDPRYRGYYRIALEHLDLVHGDALTAAGRAFADRARDKPHLAFALAFADSACGRAWMTWGHARSLLGLHPDDAVDFLAACAAIAPSTRRRRASTLRSWLDYCRPAMSQLELTDQPELPEPEVQPYDWPPTARMPHNQSAPDTVGAQLAADLASASDALVITSHAALVEVVRLLADWAADPLRRLRLLLGREPSQRTRIEQALSDTPVVDDIRHQWLEQGISPRHAGAVLRALTALEREQIEIRFSTRQWALRANLYLTDGAITLGSSGLTGGGLRRSVVSNARFTAGGSPVRYREGREFAENVWAKGIEGKRHLINLIEQMLKPSTWQETLARACAAVLDDEWIGAYEGLRRGPDLWPHQRQGIARGLWLIENVGGALVADAAGSGKTRQGAWLLRAARDQLLRTRLNRYGDPLVVSPAGVTGAWTGELRRAGMGVEVFSDGVLSNARAGAHTELVDTLEIAEIIAIDEAHRYRNPKANRSQRIRRAEADLVLLFTATPINRRVDDLVAMAELLGPENFTDEIADTLLGLIDHRGAFDNADELELIRRAIGRFMLRRTRRELDAMARHDPDGYRMHGRERSARYPDRVNEHYDLRESKADLDCAAQIKALAETLNGIGRLSALPSRKGDSDAEYVQMLKKWSRSAPALARYTVLATMRSSRAALIEHLIGTSAAVEACGLSSIGWIKRKADKGPTGDIIGKLVEQRGKPPANTPRTRRLLEDNDFEPMLFDEDAHAEACDHEVAVLRSIRTLAQRLSDRRERRKCTVLTTLRERTGASVIGFDNHQITLASLQRIMAERRVTVLVASGRQSESKRRAIVAQLRWDSTEAHIVLSTDSLSEAYNLQGASSVVHLDMPTVVRSAEQRVGRVDRLDSRHDLIHFYWPDDGEPFRARTRELLWDRNDKVETLIGSNLDHPDTRGDRPLDFDHLDALLHRDLDDAFDAFRPISDLVGDGGLITQAVYDSVRGMQGRVESRVSSVASDQPWLFAAVAPSAERRLPQWVFIEADGELTTDLGAIAERLRELLPDAAPAPFDSRYEKATGGLLGRIEAGADRLLSPRRQRALAEARAVLSRHREMSWRSRDTERFELCRAVVELLTVPQPTEGRVPDLRAMADGWLALTEPQRTHARQQRTLKERIKAIRRIGADLETRPEAFAISALRAALERAPDTIPLDKRIVALIVGVPHPD